MKNNQSKIKNPKPVLSEVEASKIDWFILAALIFIPRLLNLNVFLTPDEPLFLKHARQFAAAFTSGDFYQTVGIGYPGATVAAWTAPVVNLASTELGAYTAGRAATALLTGLLLMLLYGLSRSLLGQWPAFIGITLLALDPYSLAYSRLLHIAAPLALFMTLAGVSLILWLRDTRYRWLLLTGLFAGLALLTKSTALLLAPMFATVILGWAITTNRWKSANWWLRQLVAMLAVAAIGAVVFFVLWPAMWADPLAALDLTFGKLFTDQEAGEGNLGLFWLGHFVEDPGPAFYPVAFLLKATPWLLVGLLLSLIQLGKSLFTKGASPEPVEGELVSTSSANGAHIPPESVALWLFALTYLLFMTIASKKSIRYMLPAFPTFYLLAGLAYYRVGLWLRTSFGQRRAASRIKFVIPTVLLLLLVLFTFAYHPYYFTYYNPALLGWRWAPQTLLVGWGEGLDGAARYLNNNPERSVSAWYAWLFPIYYAGQVEAVVPQENLLTADKAVLYINQVQRDIPNPNIIHYFRTRREPEHTVRLNGIDYAWVYPGPVAGFGADPTPQFPTGGDFGGEVHLLGYNLYPQPTIGGNPLIVTLFWRVLSTPPAERFVYLRLVDETGHVWAKTDSPPVMGLWPTSRWQPDMLIEDAHELPIPPGTPPGTYRLEVGLYNPDSGETIPASGQSLGQGGGLLLGEVTIDWQSTPQAGLELVNQTNSALSPNVKLTGYGTPPKTANTGDLLPVSLAWQNSDPFFQFTTPPENQIVFEWQPTEPVEVGQIEAKQVDTFPLPVAKWGRDAALLSQHNVIVPPHLETGQYNLFLSLRKGDTPTGESIQLGSVQVTAPAHQFDLPANAQTPAAAAQLSSDAGRQDVTLAGYALDNDDGALVANLYWQTSQPLTTGYKVFTQLLAPDNTVVAQSDSIPAAGQRPTPGWLPGEIIIDTHRLTPLVDLPAGNYQLITGLYNPATGQRLPILNEAGEPVGDAIFVTEVDLP